MHTDSFRRALGAGLAALALTASAAACSTSATSTGSSGSSAAGGTYTIWDPYPQLDSGSAWVQLLTKCGTEAGVTVKRTAYDTTALTSKELLAAQQGVSPDVLIVDNPVVSTLASAGVLTTTAQTHIDTSAVESNILAAGQINGSTYGIPIGANTLALYYNKTILQKAGVDPASITNWATLTAALAKVKAIGKTGITFSAIGTEEGSFQFEPWFWGAGANLTSLSSSQAVAALSLWTTWIKDGYAPNSVLNDTQPDNWNEFAAGNTAFSENGTWELSAAEKGSFPFGIIDIPAQNGGNAPTPTGGEFVTVPVQSNTSRYATTEKLVACLTSSDNAYTTDTALSYIGATSAVQTQQGNTTAALKPWITAVQTAKGRTSDNLGTKYPKISEQLWTAVQSALSGSASPQSALNTAQSAAQNAIG
ncbi:extracellular solute-binding protein [Actinospica sp. MGRD01-02]|uniref:Extracellular solute-binding protein n=1 Tax=Actinospica acidithermotolerans TaxID=2828514 RepID=A0A941IKR1_9ACTN|nr:extracellular solute-binding protein [Actinospica acidithermotolerans]MBR7829197.1 extracellular solute-binding protein [Actinospica acidithermotolerans]